MSCRTVRLLERAGAAGIQLEDQVFPKKCGHFAGKQVIARAEMVQKIKAACDARHDGDLQIVARTDARAIEGIDAAIDRAQAYVEAGADATFVEAPLEAAELARIARELAVPQIANMVFGGLTPPVSRRRACGARVRRRALCQCRVAGCAEMAVDDVMAALRRDGSLAQVADRLAGFDAAPAGGRQAALRRAGAALSLIGVCWPCPFWKTGAQPRSGRGQLFRDMRYTSAKRFSNSQTSGNPVSSCSCAMV